MSEPYNWFQSGDSFGGWVVVHALSLLNPKTKDALMKNDKWDAENLEIELKINGIEVSFKEVMDDLGNSLDDLVERKAKEIMSEELNRLRETVNNLDVAIDQVELKLRDTWNVPKDD